MLIKASKIIGLPIFAINDGRRIDSIEDVIYDPFQNRVEALLIEKGGWFSEARVILLDDLQGIGEDAALITAPNQIRKLSDVSKNIETIAKNDTYLTNTKIITEDGRELGKVSDIYFDSATGRVEEFEVSHGTLGYWKEGKKRVKISDIVTIGKDATIVRLYKKMDDSMALDEKPMQATEQTDNNNIQEQTDRIVEEARTKTTNIDIHEETPAPEISTEKADTSDDTIKAEQPEEASPTEDEYIEPKKPETHKPPMRTDIIERRKKEVVGLYLMKNILTPDDKVIAREGEMVTYRLLEIAENENILDQVLNNVSARIPLTA